MVIPVTYDTFKYLIEGDQKTSVCVRTSQSTHLSSRGYMVGFFLNKQQKYPQVPKQRNKQKRNSSRSTHNKKYANYIHHNGPKK